MMMTALLSVASAWAGSDYQRGYDEGYRRGYDRGYEEGRRRGMQMNEGSRWQDDRRPTYLISVMQAEYGDGNRQCDATDVLAERANGQLSVSIKVSNDLCGDPAPGIRKVLNVIYLCGNERRSATAHENRSVLLYCGR
ncbi:hypothetical protein HNQ59_002849 [Chitinivorax tropicus]|uniref:Essential protein Yae1 N-terminal domain-containing protein n=1 Tax=Chitinivorax tropicus TaxID=714531 RepID=A0A840MR22_9PROT|nr:hypothetical protein [Chitinivorax tropicus]MBB5019547.1 hypothetical protein [Chitinivorax tropicus]